MARLALRSGAPPRGAGRGDLNRVAVVLRMKKQKPPRRSRELKISADTCFNKTLLAGRILMYRVAVVHFSG